MHLWRLVRISNLLVGLLPGVLSFTILYPTDPPCLRRRSISGYDARATPATTAKTAPRSTIRLQTTADSSTTNNAQESDDRIQDDSSMPLCDLQTLLRLAKISSLDTGGAVKVAIQAGACNLNGVVETRRSKKLYSGDVVSFRNVEYSVNEMVRDTNYTFQPKKEKKPKPQAKIIDEFGNKEFGGRFRSEEWRVERKIKKADRKSKNAANSNNNNNNNNKQARRGSMN
jgi:ribosome-associated protein